jgi:hypothetical protein
MVAEDEAKKMA